MNNKLSQNTQSLQTCVSSSVSIENNLTGVELFYRSEITKCYTKFKVKEVILVTQIISNTVHFSVELISENKNRYTYIEDSIFSVVPQHYC